MGSGLRFGLMCIGLAVCAFMQSGCACSCSSEQAIFRETKLIEAMHQTGSALDVEADNGGIIVKKGGDGQVSIRADFRCTTAERLAAVRATAERRSDGTLVVRAVWPEGRRSNEGCGFVIIMPEAKGLKLATNNGGIITDGLCGDAHLRTANGGIDITRHDGPIDAETRNGGIKIAGAAHPMQLRTTNGGIEVELARGFAGELDLRTGNGVVAINGGPVRYVERSRGSVRAVVNDGASPSRLRTSNGGIVVKVEEVESGGA